MTDPKVVGNETKDLSFKYNPYSKNTYLTRTVWTGTKVSNYSELTDEFGNRYTFKKFLHKIGVKKFTTEFFPETVMMTTDLRFTTQRDGDSCFCICKTIDIPLWGGRINKVI